MRVCWRFPTRLLVVAAMILSLTAVAFAFTPSVLASSVSASSERSGHLKVTKECSQFTGLADSFCTIVSSNLGAIKAGSRVVYLQAPAAGVLDSDVLLVVGPGNFAIGHVHLPLPTGPGLVTFSGGIGKFAHFHGRAVVTPDSAILKGWFWNGTYSFGEEDSAPAASALASSVSASSERSGQLHVTKECSQFTGLADSFCTIVSSNLGAIKAGSRVVYLQAPAAGVLDSDVVLVVGPGNFAIGHVHLPLPAGPGLVTFSGGIGKFTHFHGRAVVTPDSAILKGWFWNGRYSFGGDV